MTVRGKLKLSVTGHMALRVLKGETNCCNELDHALNATFPISLVSHLSSISSNAINESRNDAFYDNT